MTVKRIVTNIAAGDVAKAQAFYGDLLGLHLAMNMGWILTFTADATMTPQLSVMTEGGSGTPVPDLSIEVDNVDATHRKAVAMGFAIEYGPADEPWGERRFYIRDPFGRLVNILEH